ncbi:hypothetical protein K470DRAFT_272675 [Piedraia hortae CBS 480.64]|uniref:Uncharacterized protein n=1 Tax=Piedraia hortae CBS 480.64 TaxID=1314780 RepID=A0A6A7BSF6_9PEZI|nr:hypothetical protein K470DRAFT_272675 [Piedraia hortae CBS 480.64]
MDSSRPQLITNQLSLALPPNLQPCATRPQEAKASSFQENSLQAHLPRDPPPHSRAEQDLALVRVLEEQIGPPPTEPQTEKQRARRTRALDAAFKCIGKDSFTMAWLTRHPADTNLPFERRPFRTQLYDYQADVEDTGEDFIQDAQRDLFGEVWMSSTIPQGTWWKGERRLSSSSLSEPPTLGVSKNEDSSHDSTQ